MITANWQSGFLEALQSGTPQAPDDVALGSPANSKEECGDLERQRRLASQSDKALGLRNDYLKYSGELNGLIKAEENVDALVWEAERAEGSTRSRQHPSQ